MPRARAPARPTAAALALASLAAAVLASAGCHSWVGPDGRISETAASAHEPGWTLVHGVTLVRQDGASDCGAAALTMTLRHLGDDVALGDVLARLPPVAKGRGVKAKDLRSLAASRGVQAFIVEGDLNDLAGEVRAGRPAIVGLVKDRAPAPPAGHYEVVVGFNARAHKILTLDPASGARESTLDAFMRQWAPSGRLTLLVLPARS